ncbi:MAG: hypothetical protein WBA13_08250 [Microcoleaceae cyanobacterium]
MALLNQYSFDLNDKTTEQVIIEWLTEYPPNWIDLAVIEALYQGRYKAFSVSQIMSLWQRRGQLTYHFTAEFEHLVCKNISSNLILEQDEIQDDSESIDELNNPAPSNYSFSSTSDNIILRPIQAIVVPIQYPNFFDKLRAFAEISSEFLIKSDDENQQNEVIDVPTVETYKIIDTD